jgi:hypothetical protein
MTSDKLLTGVCLESSNRARRVHHFWTRARLIEYFGTRTRMFITLLMLSGNIFRVSLICIGEYGTRHSSQAISVIILIIIRL